jgi:hypothetical protein
MKGRSLPFDPAYHAAAFIDDRAFDGPRLIVHLDRPTIVAMFEAMAAYAASPDGEKTHDLTREQATVYYALFEAWSRLLHLRAHPDQLTGDC